MRHEIDLTVFTDEQLGPLGVHHAKLSADEDSLPWLRRFGWIVAAVVENELSHRRATWHGLTGEFEAGRLVDPNDYDDGDFDGDL